MNAMMGCGSGRLIGANAVATHNEAARRTLAAPASHMPVRRRFDRRSINSIRQSKSSGTPRTRRNTT